MENDWNSVLDIMRDLSMVQGCGVPADIDQTLGAYDKPLTPELPEEENMEPCSVDFAYPPPDLGLIQEMLNMVRDKDVSSDENSQCEMQISKNCNRNIPIKNNINTLIGVDTTAKRKPNKRNVALTSILQIKTQTDSKPLKLLKPDDFVSPDVDESVEKVNGWLDTQTSKPEKTNKKSVVLEAGNMFKKKTSVKSIKQGITAQNSPAQTVSGNYKPSEYANKIYNELKEKQRLKAMVQEDIWTRAERQMKEIDEKRKQEALKSPSSDLDSTKSQSIDLVRLPQHRHLLTGDCKVCDIMKKHNFDIDINYSIDFDDFFNTYLH